MIRSRPLRRRRGGQILVIAILAMTLLVGLIFYVYNLGWQLNRRVGVQNAADATAVSGAAWMARSMNLVAMDNVAQSRMIALSPVLDSLPLAAKMSSEETAAWADRLTEQVQALAGVSLPAVPDYVRQGLTALEQRMTVERDILQAFHGQMDPDLNNRSFDMQTVTYWALPGMQARPPHGALWQAATALDEFAQAAVASAGLAAQADAVETAQADGTKGFLTPVMPSIPALRSSFADFQPVLEGRERVTSDGATMTRGPGARGGAIPDMAYPHRLGPWARLFQWRDVLRVATGRVFVPGTNSGPQRGGGRPGIRLPGRRVGDSPQDGQGGRGGGRGGRMQPTGWQIIGYTTYGPFSCALHALDWWAVGDEDNPGVLRDTYFSTHVNRLARAKLRYMFTRPPVIRTTHYPQWITDYAEAHRVASNPNVRVTTTMFYQVEVLSTVPEDDGRFLSPGTFRTNGDRPMAIWSPGWQDPDRWPIAKRADYIWKDKWDYETTYDLELGLPPANEPNTTNPVWYKVYVVDWYVWGGIDVGGEVQVRNPCNWDDSDELPAPILLDTSQGDYTPLADEGWRREKFTYLGVARAGSAAPIWSQKFSDANPIGSAVAVAQAQVFNNRSWDLWTQDWRVQLQPLTKWQDWCDRLTRGIDEAQATQGILSPQAVQAIQTYLSGIPAETAEMYLKH